MGNIINIDFSNLNSIFYKDEILLLIKKDIFLYIINIAN